MQSRQRTQSQPQPAQEFPKDMETPGENQNKLLQAELCHPLKGLKEMLTLLSTHEQTGTALGFSHRNPALCRIRASQFCGLVFPLGFFICLKPKIIPAKALARSRVPAAGDTGWGTGTLVKTALAIWREPELSWASQKARGTGSWQTLPRTQKKSFSHCPRQILAPRLNKGRAEVEPGCGQGRGAGSPPGLGWAAPSSTAPPAPHRSAFSPRSATRGPAHSYLNKGRCLKRRNTHLKRCSCEFYSLW